VPVNASIDLVLLRGQSAGGKRLQLVRGAAIALEIGVFEIVLQIDDLLDPAQGHHPGALGAGFQRRVQRDVLQREGARPVADSVAGFPKT
jgi:hypothetical protein